MRIPERFKLSLFAIPPNMNAYTFYLGLIGLSLMAWNNLALGDRLDNLQARGKSPEMTTCVTHLLIP